MNGVPRNEKESGERHQREDAYNGQNLEAGYHETIVVNCGVLL